MEAGRIDVQTQILERTLAVVRGRARRRRLLRVGVLCGAYLAGGLTVWAIGLNREAAPPQRAAALVAAAPPAAASAPHEHPRHLRDRVARVPLAQRGELLRAAGDRYLLELDDVAGALACYQQLLELESFLGRAPRTDETWLLATLRNASRPPAPLVNAEHIP